MSNIKDVVKYTKLLKQLDDLKSEILRDEMPFSISDRKKEFIEYHIIEIKSLLALAIRELESFEE